MMCPARSPAGTSPARISAEAIGRLAARRGEIEETILTRAFAVSEPTGRESAEYILGLRAAVAAGVEYGLAAIADGAERSGPPPPVVLAQAAKAARNGIGLETVMRRYVAGYTVLGDFLVQESLSDDHPGSAEALHRVQKELAALLERLVNSVSAAYREESERVVESPKRRFAERVKRLLAGEFVDPTALEYDFDAHHIGAIAVGSLAPRLLRDLAVTLDRRLLVVDGDESTLWAWFGGREAIGSEDLASLVPSRHATDARLAIGESGQGLAGWRRTHQQARVALTVALHGTRPLTRYADVALLASILRDRELVRFLADTYLAPLRAERDGGAAMRRTLRAYFATARNASSAAASLGVSRQTVTARLRVVEDRLGRTLDGCGLEIEAALRLADLDPASTSP